jgi:hypothetical protein
MQGYRAVRVCPGQKIASAKVLRFAQHQLSKGFRKLLAECGAEIRVSIYVTYIGFRGTFGRRASSLQRNDQERHSCHQQERRADVFVFGNGFKQVDELQQPVAHIDRESFWNQVRTPSEDRTRIPGIAPYISLVLCWRFEDLIAVPLKKRLDVFKSPLLQLQSRIDVQCGCCREREPWADHDLAPLIERNQALVKQLVEVGC